jgi:lysophospholipase L1-like esterase
VTIATEQTARRAMTLQDRLDIEGEWYSTGLAAENATLTDTFNLTTFVLPSFSRAFFIESMTVASNRQVVAQAVLGGAVQPNLQQIHRVVTPAGGGSVVVPIRAFFRPAQNNNQGVTIGGIQLRKILDGTTTGGYLYGYLNGRVLYDDFNFAAKKVMLIVGDSILNSTAGVTSKTQSMEWLLRNYFIGKGIDTRIVTKAMSGSTSSDHEIKRALGGYDLPQVDYLHYQLGTNDAGNGISAATAQANLAAMIAYKQKRYPTAKMVVWGSTPRQDNTTETALAAIRSAQQAAVAAANDPKILYASLANAFDRTQGTTFYAASDGVGTGIHPNAAGHTAAFGVMQTFLDGQNFTF